MTIASSPKLSHPIDVSSPSPLVSVVVPGLNEGESLPELAKRIDAVLEPLGPYELIFVDDGSTDDTWQRISELNAQRTSVRGIRLRRNFGKAMALTAGFKLASAPLLVMMDADLQDDPNDLPRFIEKLEEGFDVVVGVESQTPGSAKSQSALQDLQRNGQLAYASESARHELRLQGVPA